MQIEEGDTNFKIPYLNIGGLNTVQLTGNASGSLIVGPSSTLKIKTTDFLWCIKIIILLHNHLIANLMR